MTKGNCISCLFWEEGLCDKKRMITKKTDTCSEWVSKNNLIEKEKKQLANSYVPNAWDEWKKKALKKEDQKDKFWEIAR